MAALLEGTTYCFVSLQCVHHSWLCSYECGFQEFYWYGFKTSDIIYQTWNTFTWPAKIIFTVSVTSTHHTFCSILFLFLHTHQLFDHRKSVPPTSIIIKVNTHLKDGGKTKSTYRISRTIRRTMIFSLVILEKNNDECILNP